jgi:hypothetical protein
MQLVVHSPFGSRLNRAWGLALRKRFCRRFNFEIQAAATEDAIVLSLSTSHSFPLDEVMRYLHSASALDVLVQALLDAPLFAVRWRWNATTALALPRFSGGKKVAPQLQRMKSEDLLAAVFPDQVACAENIAGDREVPEHPLIAQTMHDCLYEAMDAAGWLELLRRIESGAVEVLARDLPAPSPLAAEALSARPYAFLDDAPIEERRTQAVQSRRYGDPESAEDSASSTATLSPRFAKRPAARAERRRDARGAGRARLSPTSKRRRTRAGRPGSAGSLWPVGRQDSVLATRPAAIVSCGSPPSGSHRFAISIQVRCCTHSSIRRPSTPRDSRTAPRRCPTCCARVSAASARSRPRRSRNRSALSAPTWSSACSRCSRKAPSCRAASRPGCPSLATPSGASGTCSRAFTATP